MSLANTIIYGTPGEVAQHIQEGAEVNQLDEYGFYPIIEAAIANSPEKAEVLLKYGADVNQADVTGRTALHWAADNNNIPLCKLLLENKANANAYTTNGQSVLVYPLLRGHHQLKNLLYRYRADLDFAQDFINTKLLGHRYELHGYVDIVDSEGRFVELDYDGFFLEFTVDIIRHSLERFINNFAAKHLRPYFKYLQKIIQSFANASELLRYQQYTIKLQEHADKIDKLLNRELLLLPIAYEGHGVTFVKYKNLLVKCDRGENSKFEGTVVIYQITDLRRFNDEFVKQLLYKRQSKEIIHAGLKQILGLQTVGHLPVTAQIIGNCSWANVEASIPAMLFLQMLSENNSKKDIKKYRDIAMRFFSEWEAWDRERSLEECILGFSEANKARKASKAAILGAVLFQKCRYEIPKHLKVAEKILSILTIPEYQYVLKSYIEVFWKNKPTPAGKNLMQLLDDAGIKISL